MDENISAEGIVSGAEAGGTGNQGNSDVPHSSIKKNAIYNLISKLLALIIPVITTPYLARVLGEEGNGQISYVTSIVSYFILVAGLGFSIYGQREIARYQDNRAERSIAFWEIFITKLFTTLVSVAVLASILFTVGFGEKYNKLMLITSLQLVAVIFDIEYLYTGEENFKAIALRNILVKIIGVALIFAFVRTENDVWIYALYLSCSVLFSYMIMWLGLHRIVGCVPMRKLKPWKHLKGALIVFLPVIITSLFTTFDKTMIGLLSPNADYDNGCYEQAYKINNVAQTFILIFSSVTMSRNVFDFKNGNFEAMNERIYKTCRYIWMSSIFLVVGFLVLSENFSSWFFGEGYDEVPLLFCIMSVRLLVSGFSCAFGDRFVAVGKEKYWTIAVAVGAVTNVVINFFMIPVYGAIGAAIATALCEVMILVAMGSLTFNKHGLSFARVFFPCWKYLLGGLVSLGLMYLLQKYLGFAIWSFIVIGMAGAIAYAIVLLVLRDSFFIAMVQLVCSKVKTVLKRRK